jgi:UDP-glucose 4-epimerase
MIWDVLFQGVENNMERIIVTGGAGLLGSHLVDHLISEGHKVWVIDDYTTGFRENVNSKVETGKAFQLACQDLGAIDWVFEQAKPDIVYHLAAWAHEGLSQFCPNLIVENNINASMSILTSAIRYKVPRFVFTSSMSVYGDQQPPFTEGMSRSPVDIYGVSKAATESSIEILSKVYGFEYTIIRPHNVIGTRQSLSDPYRNVIGIWMNRLLKGLPFYIYGDGNQKRAFSFVNDAIPYIAKAGMVSEAKNGTFNIGAEKAYSLNETAEILLHITGNESLKPIYVPDRPQEVDFAWCSNQKAMDVLGFEDKTSFEDGLKEMWAWAKTQGPQELRYLDHMELQNESTPELWTKKKI